MMSEDPKKPKPKTVRRVTTCPPGIIPQSCWRMAVLPRLGRPKPNPGYKVKHYSPQDPFRGLWSEFYYLHQEGYTHAVNLNARQCTYESILTSANFFHIAYHDSRLVSHVSRKCVVGLTNTAGRKKQAPPPEDEVFDDTPTTTLPMDDYETAQQPPS